MLGPRAAAQSRGYAAGWHDPAEPGGDWYLTESLDLRGALRPAAGALVDYSYPPLQLRGSQLVADRVALHLRGALVIGDFLRVGVALPIVLFQHGDELVEKGAVTARGANRDAIGDLRLTADTRLFGTYEKKLRGALGLAVYLPTGSRDRYTSDGVLKIAPRFTIAGNFHDFVGALKVGMVFRTATPDFAGRELGHDAFAAVSAGIKVNDRFVLGPELIASATVTGANALSKRSFPVEALLGGHVRIAEDFQLGSSIGGGLTSADGANSLRVLALAEWAPDVCVDKDGDGICAGEDACPLVDGVRTNDPRTNGCPQDSDGDKIPDRNDRCPELRGSATMFGCPDRDGDGIVDPADACPDTPGVRSDDAAANGCPTTPDDPEVPQK